LTTEQLKLTRLLGRQSSIFFSGNVFTLLVGIPFQIYLARTIGVTELGIFSLLDGVMAVFAGLGGFGLAQTLVKYLPLHMEKGEVGQARELAKFVAIISAASGLVLLCIYQISLELLFIALPDLSSYRLEAMIMGLVIPVSLLIGVLSGGLRGMYEIRNLVLGTAYLQLVSKTMFAICFFALELGLLGYIYAVIISMLISMLWLFISLCRKFNERANEHHKKTSKEQKAAWVSFAKVMYSNSLVGLWAPFIDRFLIGALLGPAQVGVLAVVKQLALLPMIFLQTIGTVSGPIFSNLGESGTTKMLSDVYHTATDWTVRLSLPLIVFLVAFSEPILGLYGPEFSQFGQYALWILLGGFSSSLLTGPNGVLLNMCGHERPLFKLNLFTVFLQLLGLVVLIPLIGLEGAVTSTAVATISAAVLGATLVKKRALVSWWDGRYLKWGFPLTASVLFGFGVSFWLSSPGSITLVLCLVCTYLVFHGISLLQGLNDDDIELLNHVRERLWPVATH
jgi:O-antigen/teichoic acid export membrane protein